jgi:hypothetical protein
MPKPGSRQARGYDAEHERQRKAWAPRVARGEAQCHAVVCLEASRTIGRGSEWHMGHTPDRSRWTGPEHPLCNTTEGAKRGAAQRTGLRHSRQW